MVFKRLSVNLCPGVFFALCLCWDSVSTFIFLPWVSKKLHNKNHIYFHCFLIICSTVLLRNLLTYWQISKDMFVCWLFLSFFEVSWSLVWGDYLVLFQTVISSFILKECFFKFSWKLSCFWKIVINKTFFF